MKRLLLSAVLFGVAGLFTAHTGQADDDAAIRQRHDEWVAAWNKHDPHLMASFWVEQGDLIDPFGHEARGPAAIEKFFASEHTGTGVMVGTTYAGTVERIRYIGKNTAVVDVAAEVSGLKGPDGGAQPPLKHHVTWVATKKAGQWMAVAARPCVYVPPPAPAK